MVSTYFSAAQRQVLQAFWKSAVLQKFQNLESRFGRAWLQGGSGGNFLLGRSTGINRLFFQEDGEKKIFKETVEEIQNIVNNAKNLNLFQLAPYLVLASLLGLGYKQFIELFEEIRLQSLEDTDLEETGGNDLTTRVTKLLGEKKEILLQKLANMLQILNQTKNAQKEGLDKELYLIDMEEISTVVYIFKTAKAVWECCEIISKNFETAEEKKDPNVFDENKTKLDANFGTLEKFCEKISSNIDVKESMSAQIYGSSSEELKTYFEYAKIAFKNQFESNDYNEEDEYFNSTKGALQQMLDYLLDKFVSKPPIIFRAAVTDKYVEKLKKKIVSNEKELKKLQSEIEKRIESRQKTSRKGSETINSINSEIEKLNEEKNKLTAEKSAKLKEITDLKNQLSKQVKELETQLSEKKDRVQELQTSLQLKEDMAKNTTVSNKRKASASPEKRQKLGRRESVVGLPKQFETTLLDRINKLRSEIGDKNKKITKLESEIKTKTVLTNSANKTIENLKNQQKKAEKEKNELLGTHEEQVKNLEQELKSTKDELSNLKIFQEEQNAKMQNIEDLEKKLAELKIQKQEALSTFENSKIKFKSELKTFADEKKKNFRRNSFTPEPKK